MQQTLERGALTGGDGGGGRRDGGVGGARGGARVLEQVHADVEPVVDVVGGLGALVGHRAARDVFEVGEHELDLRGLRRVHRVVLEDLAPEVHADERLALVPVAERALLGQVRVEQREHRLHDQVDHPRRLLVALKFRVRLRVQAR